MSDQGSPTRTLRLTPAANTNTRAETDDQLSTELDAIITIGRALSHIPDAETRARVMRWAIERFGIDVAPPAEPANEPGGDLVVPASAVPVAAQPAAPAESLNLEGLNELFPVDAAETPAADQQFALSRSRDRKTKSSAGDRLRDALHWMGI